MKLLLHFLRLNYNYEYKPMNLLVLSVLFQVLSNDFAQLLCDGSRIIEWRNLVVLTGVHAAVKSCSKDGQKSYETHVLTGHSDSCH